MESNFQADFFKNNRTKLKKLFPGTAPIVLTANGLLQRDSSNTYPFVQDASFWYLSGLDYADILLVIDNDDEYLILPERTVSQEFFDGAFDLNKIKTISGVDKIFSSKEGHTKLKNRIKKVKHVATLAALPKYLDGYGFYTNPARSRLIKTLKNYNHTIDFLDLKNHLMHLRVIKQDPEIKAIKRAIDLNILSLNNTLKANRLSKYNYEYEIEAELEKNFRQRGGKTAFESIVASGLNACTLHYLANNSSIDKNGLLLIDCGVSIDHYCSDITMTIPINKFSRRQKAIYKAVKDVQSHAMSLLKPGVILKDYEADVAHYMGEKLRELSLIKSISEDNVRLYFPSLTSHFLGIDVHDSGSYTEPLQAGMVLTVEPGIYIKDEAIGVRIEDDVLITKTGNINLSRKLKRD